MIFFNKVELEFAYEKFNENPRFRLILRKSNEIE